MKAFELTVDGEVVQTQSVAFLMEVVQHTGIKRPRFTCGKDKLEELEVGAKFTVWDLAKVGEKLQVRVVEFKPEVEETVAEQPAKKNRKVGTGFFTKAVAYIASQHNLDGAVVTIVPDKKRIWVAVNGQNTFWVAKPERAAQVVEALLKAYPNCTTGNQEELAA